MKENKFMNRKRKTLEKWAKELGEVVAHDFFHTFNDPESRGPNFTWEKFPDIVNRYVRIQVFLGCSDREYERLGEELITIASEAARKKCAVLVKEKRR